MPDKELHRSFAEGVAQFNHEAAGLLRVEVIRPEHHLAIAAAALAGDKAAWTRVNAILESQQYIGGRAEGERALCLSCPSPVDDPDATLAILVAAHDDGSVAIASALCPQCSAGEASKVLERAAAAYQAAWPGLRVVSITHPEGGRA